MYFFSFIRIFIIVIVWQCLVKGALFSTSYKELFGPQLPLHLLFLLMETLPLTCIWLLFSYPLTFNRYVISSERLSMGTLCKIILHCLLTQLNDKFLITLTNIWNYFIYLLALFLLSVRALRKGLYLSFSLLTHQHLAQCLADRGHSIFLEWIDVVQKENSKARGRKVGGEGRKKEISVFLNWGTPVFCNNQIWIKIMREWEVLMVMININYFVYIYL